MSAIKLSLPSMGKAQELFKNNISKPVSNAIESINISDVAVNVSDVAVNVANNVEEFAINAKDTISSTGAAVGATLSNVKESVSNTITNDFVPWASNAAIKLIDINTKTTATIGTGLTSLVEGIGKFGGSIVDAGAILGTGIASIVTGIIDGGQAIHGAITGKEWSSVTKSMWGGTMDFVKTEYVGNAFDSFYANTGVGSWLKENSYGFDTTRGIGNAVGEIAGLIALTFFTAGIGTAATGAGAAASGAGAATSGISTAVSTTAKVANSSSKIMAGINAASGLGRGAEKSWNEGASCLEGLGYGSLLGAWNAIQVGAGMKIQGLKWPFPEGMSGKAITKVLNSSTRVILDGIDNGAEAFAQPLLEMIYKDKDYQTLFEEAGGWSNFGTQAVAGSFFSVLGETGNLTKKIQYSNDVEPRYLKDLSTNSNIDDELELAFFSGNKKKNEFINKIKKSSNYIQNNNMSSAQKSYVNQINELLQKNLNSFVSIKLNNTTQITPAMLNSIDDLSRVKISFDNSYRDINGSLKTKYNKDRYIDRITYTGKEALSIVTRLDQLHSMIDMTLPTKERAYQIYKVLASEIPVMRDYNSYVDGHMVAASFRGLTANNIVGKEGLVCAGYASVYKELCNRCGITCDYIRGIASLDPLTGKKSAHAWNVVIDDNGEVIPVDVTWKASGAKEWFGKSEAFANSRIADPDEYFNNYRPEINIRSSNSNNVIDNIVNTINQKYGQGTGITALENYFNTGNKNSITRTNNARAMLDQINMDDINSYLLKNSPDFRNDQLSNIEYIMDQKFGYGQGKIRLVEYINTGDANVITRTDNARQIVQSISIDDIVNYLNGGFR